MTTDIWAVAAQHPATAKVIVSRIAVAFALPALLFLAFALKRLDAKRAARWMRWQLDRPWLERTGHQQWR